MKKILIVDDENDVREMIFSLLESFIDTDKIEIFEASSFSIAQDHISENNFDLLITDLCLSGVSGLDLMKFVRHTAQNKVEETGIQLAEIVKNSAAENCKVVAVTGLAELIDYKDKFEMFDQVIQKPFDEKFPDIIQKLLDS